MDVDNHVLFSFDTWLSKEKNTRRATPQSLSSLYPLLYHCSFLFPPAPVIVLNLGVMSILEEEGWIISERQRKIHKIN